MRNPQNLSKLLKSWKVEAQLPPSFAQDVWRKVEKCDTSSSTNIWSFLQLKPIVGYVCVAALILVGGSLGIFAGKVQSEKSVQIAKHAYLMSVNPFAHE